MHVFTLKGHFLLRKIGARYLQSIKKKKKKKKNRNFREGLGG